MYSSCLFCNADLGRNEVMEHFPVGRRLAFDAAKGRLWVVCRQCERWNLTPLEERWEAVEACERAFSETRLRVSTDEIGLARLREGLELVRIGAPQRPEMAAWRYGDQFGRRQRRTLVLSGAAVVGVGGLMIAGPMLGLLGGGTIMSLNLFNLVRAVRRQHVTVASIPSHAGALTVNADNLAKSAITWDARIQRWGIEVRHSARSPNNAPWWHVTPQSDESTSLTDDEALRAARLLLPVVNATGAGARAVREAVDYLEESPRPELMFARAARSFAKKDSWTSRDQRVALQGIPKVVRLALEMSANEETERRALDGELHLLASAWKEADEIAGIADGLFVSDDVRSQLARLKEPPRE